MDARFGLWRKLSAKELMLLNCSVGEDSCESLDCKEIQPVHRKGDQSWVIIGRTDAEAESPLLWPLHVKSWLIGKDPDAGGDGDWGKEEKGTTEDEMAGWHHQLDAHESGLTPGVGDGQGGLACCDSWGHKESDTTEWLNWTLILKFLSRMVKFLIVIDQVMWITVSLLTTELTLHLWNVEGIKSVWTNCNILPYNLSYCNILAL